jgi:hypothetical protein
VPVSERAYRSRASASRRRGDSAAAVTVQSRSLPNQPGFVPQCTTHTLHVRCVASFKLMGPRPAAALIVQCPRLH